MGALHPTASKDPLRATLRQCRDAIPVAQRAAWSEQLAAHGVDALRARVTSPGAIVGAYWPIRSEADPRPLARALAALGARLALPVVDGDAMHFRVWDRDDELVPAGFGALGPGPAAARLAPTIVLAPQLGFDAHGQRLGWGKGFYDRYLAQCAARPFVVGIAFACQQVVAIPSEPHDHRLDAVLTESGWLRG